MKYSLTPYYSKTGEEQGLDIFLVSPEGEKSWVGSRRTLSQCDRYLKFLGVPPPSNDFWSILIHLIPEIGEFYL